MGRYLESEYPGYPDAYPNAEMPDPLAIQISNIPTLTVQGSIFSMGLSITILKIFILSPILFRIIRLTLLLPIKNCVS